MWIKLILNVYIKRGQLVSLLGAAFTICCYYCRLLTIIYSYNCFITSGKLIIICYSYKCLTGDEKLLLFKFITTF
mgnify:CR=1 FL=1